MLNILARDEFLHGGSPKPESFDQVAMEIMSGSDTRHPQKYLFYAFDQALLVGATNERSPRTNGS
jgi:hypothetical protein